MSLRDIPPARLGVIIATAFAALVVVVFIATRWGIGPLKIEAVDPAAVETSK